MKNSNDTIGNRTRDLPTSSAVPQPTAPPRDPNTGYFVLNNINRVFRIMNADCVLCKVETPVLYLSYLSGSLLLPKPGFNPGPVYVKFVVDK